MLKNLVAQNEETNGNEATQFSDGQQVEIEYMPIDESFQLTGVHKSEFSHIFSQFTFDNKGKREEAEKEKKKEEKQKKKKEEEEDLDLELPETISRRALKKQKRITVFDLKMQVQKPDLVEAWDISA